MQKMQNTFPELVKGFYITSGLTIFLFFITQNQDEVLIPETPEMLNC